MKRSFPGSIRFGANANEYSSAEGGFVVSLVMFASLGSEAAVTTLYRYILIFRSDRERRASTAYNRSCGTRFPMERLKRKEMERAFMENPINPAALSRTTSSTFFFYVRVVSIGRR